MHILHTHTHTLSLIMHTHAHASTYMHMHPCTYLPQEIAALWLKLGIYLPFIKLIDKEFEKWPGGKNMGYPNWTFNKNHAKFAWGNKRVLQNRLNWAHFLTLRISRTIISAAKLKATEGAKCVWSGIITIQFNLKALLPVGLWALKQKNITKNKSR